MRDGDEPRVERLIPEQGNAYQVQQQEFLNMQLLALIRVFKTICDCGTLPTGNKEKRCFLWQYAGSFLIVVVVFALFFGGYVTAIVLMNSEFVRPEAPYKLASFLAHMEVPLFDGSNSIIRKLSHLSTRSVDFSYFYPKYINDLYNEMSYSRPLTNLVTLKQGCVGIQNFILENDLCEEDSKTTSMNKIMSSSLILSDIYTTYDDIVSCYNSSDVYKAYRTNKICGFSSTDGSYFIENKEDLGVLLSFTELRIFSLCSRKRNCQGQSSWYSGEGLTDFGKEMVQILNNRNIIIDLSNCEKEVIMSTFSISSKPSMLIGTNSKELCDHESNVDESILENIVKEDGLILMSFNPLKISQELYEYYSSLDTNSSAIEKLNAWKEKNEGLLPDIYTLIQHIKKIQSVVGWDRIGFGSEFEDFDFCCNDLCHPNTSLRVLGKLLELGNSQQDIRKAMGESFINFLMKFE